MFGNKTEEKLNEDCGGETPAVGRGPLAKWVSVHTRARAHTHTHRWLNIT